MSNSGRSVAEEDSLCSGLITYPLLDQLVPALRVSWIPWDSGFRGSGLRVGDEIVAVNGISVTKPAANEIERIISTSVGQYNESQFWTKQKAKEGDAITLSVRRRNRPGEGWLRFDFRGELRLKRKYLNAQDRWVVCPGGPEPNTDDGFPGSWGGWVDETTRHLTNTLEGAWQPRPFSSRFELERHLEFEQRVNYFAEHYPVPLSAALKEDWLAGREILSGRKYEISTDELKYRRAEQEQVDEVTNISRLKWDEFLKTRSSQTVEPFPGMDPIKGDLTKVVGKYVVLPQLGNRDWITEAAHNWLVSGQDQTYYFINAEAPAAERMMLAARRYKRIVAPSIRDEYLMVCQVLPEPRLMAVNDRGIFGMQLEPVAAMVGDAMFVDLTIEENGVSRFAGEEAFLQPSSALPPNSASPRQVLEAFTAALKEGDLSVWKQLFADWAVSELPDGRRVLSPNDVLITDNTWEDSRRRILGDVFGIAVLWVDEPQNLFSGSEFEGAPRIEQVTAEIDHVGLFDGEYRAFSKPSFNRFWTLQRVNDGPWRISSAQGL
jgi:hypothetical protein